MKMLALAKKNTIELLRDPLTLIFGIGFPVALILLLSAIQANVPVELFEPQSLTSGMSVFGLSFITLFSALIIAKDRGCALMQHLYTAPLRASDFILAYTLPLLPVALVQCVICYAVGLALGLKLSVNLLLAILLIVPAALLYVGLGLLCGSVFNEKQIGGFCGALLTNLTAWLSGIWFDVELVGGFFEKLAKILPFWHAVKLEQAVLSGGFSEIPQHLFVILGYASVALTAAVLLFLRQMKKQ